MTLGQRRPAALTLRLALAISLLLAGVSAADGKKGGNKLRAYETRYYTLHSDLDIEQVREAAVRITSMAEEYHRRTRGFGKTLRDRLPFYLFANAAEYHAAGGLPGSAGVYAGNKLMALAGGPQTWSTVQHEGFHQFVHRAIGGEIPVWVNEGLAEYFGHGVWTGDGFVSGIIPESLRRRMVSLIEKKQLQPFEKMLQMSYAEWSAALNRTNYDQAWAMVIFLVQAEDGKYQEAFGKFIADISRGSSYVKAFKARFGTNVDAFEEKFNAWWTALPADSTAELETRVLVETLTSYLARAQVLQLRPKTAEEFFTLARDGKIAVDGSKMPDLWLPQSLLKEILEKAQRHKTWKLQAGVGFPRLILELDDGTVMTGRFTIQNLKKVNVDIDIKRPAPKPVPGAPQPR